MDELRVAVWAAVSSREQAAGDKTSLSDQEAAGRRFAAEVGGTVSHVFVVPGESRDLVFWPTDIAAYAELRRACEARAFDVLHALDVDRLGRDPALSAQVISLVEKSGAEVYLASAPHVLGHKTVGARYVSAIQSVRAAEDQALRRIRHDSGMRGRVRRGHLPGRSPYGYRRVDGQDVVRPDEAPAVRLMTDLYLRGETFARIRDILNQSPYHPRRTRRWGSTTVKAILRNDVYAGYPHWGGVRPEDASTAYPHLWDLPTYQAVLRERERRHSSHSRRQSGPLLGVVFCARCGGRMVRHRNRTSHSLRCATHVRWRDAGWDPCHTNTISEADLIQELIDYLAGMSDRDIEAYVQGASGPRDYEGEIRALDDRIAEVEGQRENLAMDRVARVIDAAMYRQLDDRLAAELDQLRTHMAVVQDAWDAEPDADQLRDTLHAVCARAEALFRMPARQVSTLLQQAGLRVLVEEGEIVSLALGG